ncbi:MAG: hypothetical protein WD058_07315 [Dehalococcoidia bacterium]
MPQRIQRAGPLLLYATLALAFFAATTLGSYVYAHEPPRDALVLDVQATPVPDATTVAGTIVSIEGGELVLATADGGRVTLTLAPGAPIEDLVRAQEALPAGASVNVGVDNTAFGQVFTGVVAVEGGN